MCRIPWLRTRLLAAVGQPAAQLAEGRRLAALALHPRAVRQFTRAAKGGSVAACFELGRAYLLGLGLPPCPGAAVRWLLIAAKAGQTEAQLMLASLALQGVTEHAVDTLFKAAATRSQCTADYRLALHWAQMAAASGSAQAQALLGFILIGGPLELRDLARADELYRQAAEAGDPHGQLGWSVALLGRGFTEDVHQAAALLQAAARSGIPAAYCMLGVIAENGLGAAPDLAAAAGCYRKAAELGHGASQFRYGLTLLHGRGVAPDLFQAETWLRRAALGGEMQAAATLGNLYAGAGPLPPNHAEAMIWFRHAAEGGHGGAARALAHLHLYGRGVCADLREALCWLRIAVASGSLLARADLAGLALSLALNPAITEDDQRAALTWFRQCAAAGDTAAAFNVGLCCAEGVGMKQDDQQALIWFRQAAVDLAIAQFWCGRMLAEGRGAACDLPAALGWFMRAAGQGHEDAAVAAGEMLANGRGAAPDPRLARELFTRAAVAGHAGALFALAMLTRGACGEPEDLVASAAYLRRAADHGHPRARIMLDSGVPGRTSGNEAPATNNSAAAVPRRADSNARLEGDASARVMMGRDPEHTQSPTCRDPDQSRIAC